MSNESPPIPAWVTAGSPPPAFITAHASVPIPWGSAGPPSSILSQMTALTREPSASMTGMPTGMSPLSGLTGPPAGATGPPAGFPIPSGVTGIPAGVTGFPDGATGPPAGGPQAMPSGVHGVAYSSQQVQVMNGTTAMFLALCFIAVSARLLARALARMRFEADDWTCVAAFIFFLGMCIEQFLLGMYGQRISSPGPHSFGEMRPLLAVGLSAGITYLFVTCLSKYCVLALYRRLFSLRTKWFRILWWICVAVNTIYFAVTLTLQMTTCTPVSKHWTNPAECAFPKDKLVSSGFENAAIDLAILVLPIRTVWNLQLSSRKKIAICGVFSLGLLAVAVSLARVCIIVRHSASADGGSDFIIWSNAEPAVAIICSCLPVLRPLYTYGLAKIGFHTPWSLYTFRRSKRDASQGTYSRSGNADQTDTNITGTTLQSDRDPDNADDKKWYYATDAEIGSAGYDERSTTQSPVSPLDKPLPPAYTECEGDTAYHTWTWNLLSRPRDERKSPTLTRQTNIKETGYPWRDHTRTANGSQNQLSAAASRGLTGTNNPHPLRFEAHTPILDRFAKASSPQQPRPAENPSTSASPRPSPSSRPLSKKNSLSMRPLPLNSAQQPARPKPVARDDRLEPRGISAPHLAVRPQPHFPPSTHQTTFPNIISNVAAVDGNSNPAAGHPGNHTRPTTRPRRSSHVSELAMSPHASPNQRPSLPQQRSYPAVQLTAPAASAAAAPASNNTPALKATDGEDGDVDRIYPALSSQSRDGRRAEGRNESRVRGRGGEKRPAHWSPSVTSAAPGPAPPASTITVSSPPGSRTGRGGGPPRGTGGGRAPLQYRM